MSVVKLTNENFKKEVIESEVPVLVDFYADWCGPCKVLTLVIEKLSSELGNKAKVCKINIDQAQDLAGQYRIMSIPTLMIFNKGEKVDQTVGALPKDQILSLIEKYL